MDEITEEILQLARHSEGVRASDKRLSQWTSKKVHWRLSKLVESQALHRVTVTPRNVRYFAHERDAKLAERRVAHMSMLSNSTGKPATAGTRPAEWADMPAEVTERTKYTLCPSPPERFSATPLPGSIIGALQRGRVRWRYE